MRGEIGDYANPVSHDQSSVNLMKNQTAFLTILLSLLIAACGAQPNLEPAPTDIAAASSAINVSAETTVPTAAAVSQPSSEPTATPGTLPAPEANPYAAARQILELAAITAPIEWQVTPCEGEVAVLCIGDGQENIGYAELLLSPVSGYAEDHPLRLAAAELPAEAAAYTADHNVLARQALASLAEEHLEVIAADRAITYPDDKFTPQGQEQAQMGALAALAFGFMRTNEGGTTQERYLNVAAFDKRFVYWLGINFDPSNVSSFVSDTAVIQYTPVFYEIAASLPIHTPNTADSKSLPLLPPLTSYSEQSGELPGGLTWALKTELPQAAAAVPVLSQPARIGSLTAEQAANIAITYGFNGPLYVEARPGLTVNDAADLGMFVAFDGSRTLSLAAMPYSYSDIANWNQGLDLPFNEAAPIAEQFLLDKRWLTFPYAMDESTQGEGVLFLPILGGVQLLSPAYGVRVAGNGQVSGMFIYTLDTLTPAGEYPIMTSNMAWASLEKNLNQPGTFYRIKQPVLETTAVAFPTEYSNIPPAKEQGEFYTNIWAYRPLTGDFPPIVRSSDFFHVKGDVAMLNELVEQSDFLLHLWGKVDEPVAGLRELALSRWEAIEDAGGLPMFFGTIQQDGNQTFLVDEDNRTKYLLSSAPADLESGDYAAVSGPSEKGDNMNQLLWQKITVYPPQPEVAQQPTDVPIQTITIDSAKLVYIPQPASVSGLADNLYIPAWEFSGVADNGALVTVWVTAVKPEFFAVES